MVYVEAQSVWNYFQKYKEELHVRSKVIADRPDYGVEIHVTDADGVPLIVAFVDDEEVAEELAFSQTECYNTVCDFYNTYLSEDFLMDLLESDGILSEKAKETAIEEREEELSDATYYALDAFVQNIAELVFDADELIEDVKDHLCEYLYEKHGLSVYRPMYLECEDGTDEFCEFPYDEMELE